VAQDPDYVKDGRVTEKGIAALKARMPHVDFSKFEADPQIGNVANVFTVGALVKFVEGKLGKA
jgi:acyl carrier protein